ncbi:MAG: hypothetical protein ISR59_03040 [Anaerolineales bacterium]|uniref:Uncharacterized protein n=1 Tax=Candidatus Desulfolinea nitratireducens TaxID=2841698 RepID=A0A8J6NJI3_9CHLR|nr:hypothetical protein [Candidatus Desulfolinea nitratireducens]MBL6960058.1 hypothetical protein [Anaerolineales bacterium]
MSKKTKIRTKEDQKTEEEHMMETFPEPRGMPNEWSLSDLADAKTKRDLLDDKKVVSLQKSAKESNGDSPEMKKDEEHLIETFPKPRTMPSEWHCNNCD